MQCSDFHSPIQYRVQLSLHFQRPHARLFQLRLQLVLAFLGNLLQFFSALVFHQNELFFLHTKRRALSLVYKIQLVVHNRLRNWLHNRLYRVDAESILVVATPTHRPFSSHGCNALLSRSEAHRLVHCLVVPRPNFSQQHASLGAAARPS